ncbi:MAG: zinc transporter ZntB [Desulfobacterium sp.]|nr:zinc transporter ZntB [Desulfobacterium sp.]
MIESTTDQATKSNKRTSEQEENTMNIYRMDRKGNGTPISPQELDPEKEDNTLIWVHMDYENPDDLAWLKQQTGLAPIAREALISEETRPRSQVLDEGLMLSLRGINYEDQDSPEDMIALRLWVEKNRVFSSSARDLRSIAQIENLLAQGRGPKNMSEFLVLLVRGLVEGIEDALAVCRNEIDELEEATLDRMGQELKSNLMQFRHRIIIIRRYLAPQRDALTRLSGDPLPWLTKAGRLRLREAGHTLVRCIEDLDAMRDQAAIIQEEWISQNAQQLNSRMYVLSIITIIFLPLSFFTGLLGINVGGIPGADNPHAFLIIAVVLVSVVILQLLILKKNHWL